ncbi:MAG: hypothetical protein M1546_04465, partial [Chloroflexi bacterium]|nr:hypothetical protein [Chloroflexota bacterium]
LISSNTTGACPGVFRLSNETGVWGFGGYVMELKPILGSVLAEWIPADHSNRTKYILPGLDVELHATPLSKSSPGEIIILGDQTVGTMTTDTSIFLLRIALDFVPAGCVVPEEQIFLAALRTSDIVDASVKLALKGDFVGAKAELSQVVADFYGRASDTFRDL